MVGLEPATYEAFARVYAPCGQAVMATNAHLSGRQRSAARRALRLTGQESNLRDEIPG